MRASTKGARRRAGRPSTSRPPIRRYHYVTDDPAALASRSGTVTVSTNSSVGPLQLELLPPKNAGFGRNWQLPMSSACLRHFGTRHRWMGAPGARGGGAFRDHAGGWVCGLRGWLVAALPLHELQQLATSTATLPGVSLPIPGCVPTKGASTATNAYWRASPGAAARPPPPPPASQPTSSPSPCPPRATGFIDSDEYVLLQPGVPSLPALLDRYSSHGGVVLHWRLFSSGPHVVRPSGGVLASYTSCCPAGHPQHSWGKTFLQPAHAVAPRVTAGGRPWGGAGGRAGAATKGWWESREGWRQRALPNLRLAAQQGNATQCMQRGARNRRRTEAVYQPAQASNEVLPPFPSLPLPPCPPAPCRLLTGFRTATAGTLWTCWGGVKTRATLCRQGRACDRRGCRWGCGAAELRGAAWLVHAVDLLGRHPDKGHSWQARSCNRGLHWARGGGGGGSSLGCIRAAEGPLAVVLPPCVLSPSARAHHACMPLNRAAP